MCGLLLAWVVATLLAGCLPERSLPQSERVNASIREVERFEAPASAQASVVLTPGDFVIEGNGLRVVVGGLRRGASRRAVILEASGEGVPAAESIVLLASEVYVRGTPRRIEVQRMFILQRHNREYLRTEGSVWVDDRTIAYARELSLGRVPGTLLMSTRLETLAPEGEADVRVGARIAWGGPHPVIPGFGTIDDQSFHRGELLGVAGANGSTSFAYLESALSARGQYEDRSHGQALLYTSVLCPAALKLERAKAAYVRSVLAVAAGGLSVTARRIGFARGRPFAEVWAQVPYHPEGAEVTLSDAASREWMSGRPAPNGSVVLPVMPLAKRVRGGLFLSASAYGHAPSERLPVQLGPQQASVVLTIPRGGRVRLKARDAVTGEPIAVRARLIPLEGTLPLALGPDYRASGARDTVVVLRGEADIAVPPGRYRAIVTHGTEWSFADVRLDVTETYSPRIDAALRHEVDPGDWIASEFHVHSEPSPDSEVTLDDRAASLWAEGIGFVATTDHDLVTDLEPALRGLGIESLRTVPGVEVTTLEPVLGHFNVFPLRRDVTRPGNGAPDPLNVEVSGLFRTLHALDPDLVIQVNHPRIEGGIGYFDVMSYDTETGAADPRFSPHFDAMEVFNGFDLARPANVDLVFNDWLAVLAREQRVVATGSSDSHQIRYQVAGYPRTYVSVAEAELADPRSVVRALKAGRAFVSSGPFVEVNIGGKGPGGTASVVDGKVSLEVLVRSPEWMSIDRLEVFVGRTRVVDQPIAPLARLTKPAEQPRAARLTQTLELPIETDNFVVVRVSGKTPMDDFFGRQGVLPQAFTNPIFADVDGDQKTPWSP